MMPIGLMSPWITNQIAMPGAVMVVAGRERETREALFADRLTGLTRGSLFALAAFLLLSIAVCGNASASTLPSQFREFKSICSIVWYRADPKIQSSLNWEATNKSVAASLEARLREKGLNFPVAYGDQCYPGNLPRSPKVLGLFFYVTVADAPEQQLALAIIVHSFSQGVQFSLHDHPTAIKFCSSDDVQSCVINQLNAYVDENLIDPIERAANLTKGDRQ